MRSRFEPNPWERVLTFFLGLFYFLWLIVSTPIRWMVHGIWILLCDVIKSIYGKIVAGLATLLLIGLGFQFFGSLLN